MKFWVFAHGDASSENWLDDYKERFDAWAEAGVEGEALGRVVLEPCPCPRSSLGAAQHAHSHLLNHGVRRVRRVGWHPQHVCGGDSAPQSLLFREGRADAAELDE